MYSTDYGEYQVYGNIDEVGLILLLMYTLPTMMFFNFDILTFSFMVQDATAFWF